MNRGFPTLVIAVLAIFVACSDAPTDTLLPSTIVFLAPPDSIAVGDSVQVTAEVQDAQGNTIAGVTLQWTSTDTLIMTVDQEGWVRAEGAGSVRIVASLGDLHRSIPMVSFLDRVRIALERGALEALYHATGGPEWKNNANWLTNEPLLLWHGVETDHAERVVGLRLSNNHLTGTIPPEIWNLRGLRRLNLCCNDLSGEISPLVGNLVELVSLSLGVNSNLSGEIPPEIGNLAKLEVLWIPGTGLTGPIPLELGELSRLREVWLSGNDLTGAIPPELGNLQELGILFLDQNNLSGSIPPELGNLSSLKILTLNRNPLTGAIPPELGRLAQLETLSLDSTTLSGPIPPELGDLPNILRLTLGGQLTGPIPPELGNLATLERLLIYSHTLTGAIPPELGKLANLTVLGLSGYGITGSIPAELWSLGKLKWLTLAYTGLTGSIPPEIGNLSNLQTLQLIQAPGDFGRRGAAFAGPLPSELGQLSNLRSIRIGHHAFTGPLPPELGNLSNLTELIVVQGQGGQSRDGIGLTGAIPPELAKLSGLKSIWLDSNQLSDTLPPELGSLADLKAFLIGNNNLEGRVPDSFLDLDLEWFIWNNNPLCLPDTPAFKAWRARIPSTRGSYCAAGAAADDAPGSVMQTITVELLDHCEVLSGSGGRGTSDHEQAQRMILRHSVVGLIRSAEGGCQRDLPDQP